MAAAIGHLTDMDKLSTTPIPPGEPDAPPPSGPGSVPPLPEPDVLPSSTPDGPQVIPSPSTPEGEPGPDPAPDTDVRDSDPNAASRHGLAGDLGVSSERVPDDPSSIEGTGSRGTAVGQTNGTWPTS